MDRLRVLIHIQDVFVSNFVDLIEERRSDCRVPQGVSKCRTSCGDKLFVKGVVVGLDITVEVAKMPGHSK